MGKWDSEKQDFGKRGLQEKLFPEIGFQKKGVVGKWYFGKTGFLENVILGKWDDCILRKWDFGKWIFGKLDNCKNGSQFARPRTRCA